MDHGFVLWNERGNEVPQLATAPDTDVARFDAPGVTVATTGGASAESIGAEYLRTGRIDSPVGPSSVVVHDERRHRTLAARDRTGLAPLFHATTPAGAFGVSTDARSLTARTGQNPSRIAVAAWLVGAPLAPDETLLARLSRVPAGHVLERIDDREHLVCVWAPPSPGALPRSAAAEFGPRLEEVVEELTGNTTAAILLSGGIDSSAVATAAAARLRPLALSVEFAGASERAVQRLIAAQLGLRHLEAELQPDDDLLTRGLDRIAESLWPTPALWAPVFDALVLEAQAAGARVVLDGQGGDDLLDAGIAGGAALLRRPTDFARWALAERRYTGSALGAARAAVALRLRRTPETTLPAWIAPDPSLRAELRDRLASAPRGYAERRRLDVVDPVLAAQREATYDRGLRIGMRHLHPLWHPRIVELLDGLPPAALVGAGDPKAPALHYLRSRLEEPRGAWPRPSLADDLLGRAVSAGVSAAWERFGGGPRRLAALGVLAETPYLRDFSLPEIATTLSLESWIHGLGGEAP